MSLVFQNIDLPPPSPPGECVPPFFLGGGGTHSPGEEGGGGLIFWNTRDIGLPSYSNNLSTGQWDIRGGEKDSGTGEKWNGG